MSNRLSDKVVIVTGAAQGIGFGCANLIASEGAAVMLGDVQEERGELAATQIRSAGGKAGFCKADVKNEKDCAGLVNKAVEIFGKVDGLVNNAGWFPRGTLEETTTELWEAVMQINLRGSFYCCKHAVPVMRETGGGKHCKYGIDLRNSGLAESRGVRGG